MLYFLRLSQPTSIHLFGQDKLGRRKLISAPRTEKQLIEGLNMQFSMLKKVNPNI